MREGGFGGEPPRGPESVPTEEKSFSSDGLENVRPIAHGHEIKERRTLAELEAVIRGANKYLTSLQQSYERDYARLRREEMRRLLRNNDKVIVSLENRLDELSESIAHFGGKVYLAEKRADEFRHNIAEIQAMSKALMENAAIHREVLQMEAELENEEAGIEQRQTDAEVENILGQVEHLVGDLVANAQLPEEQPGNDTK